MRKYRGLQKYNQLDARPVYPRSDMLNMHQSQHGTLDIEEELIRCDDKVYLNVAINSDYEVGKPIKLAKYQATTTTAIIDVPSKYYLAIERFQIPTQGVPLLNCPIKTGQADPNLTPFTFKLRKFTGTDPVTGNPQGPIYTQNVIYTPNIQVATGPIATPKPPLVEQDLSSSYYNIFSYTRFVELFNVAIQEALNQLLAATPGWVTSTKPAKFRYNPDNRLIELIYPSEWIGKVELYTNYEMIVYLDGFELTEFYGTDLGPYYWFRFDPKVDPENYHYEPGQTPPVTVAYPGNATPYFYKMSQQYSTIQEWSSFINLVITTGTIPVIPESSQARGSDTGTIARLGILTDFQPSLDEPGIQRGIFNYFPQGPRRYINLTGNVPLKTIDFQIFWQDKEGRLFPLEIPFGQQVSVKMIFAKKATVTD